MQKSLIAFALSAALAACGAPNEDLPEAPTVYEAMTGQVEPASEDIQGAAFDIYNDAGELDASLIGNERWASLSETAGELEALGIAFAEAEDFTVAREDVMLLDEGEEGVATKADVRSYIAAREEAFREEWTRFAAAAQAVEQRTDLGGEDAARGFRIGGAADFARRLAERAEEEKRERPEGPLADEPRRR